MPSPRAVLASLAVLLLAPAAHSLTVTFGGFSHGEVAAAASGTIDGVTFTIDNKGGGPDLGVVFDTELGAGTTADEDLLRLGVIGVDGVWDGGNLAGGFVFGNALIIQENSGGCSNVADVCTSADDEAGGGTIDISFAPVLAFGLDVIDIDSGESSGPGGLTYHDSGSAATAFFSWATLLGAGSLNDNSANRVALKTAAELGFSGFDQVTVEFEHSGAIDNVQLPGLSGPEASTSSLVTAGLLAVGILRRRSRRHP